MIKTPKLRETLLNLCKEGLEYDTFQSVLQELTSEGNTALVNVLSQFCQKVAKGVKLKIPQVFSDFLHELCKNSPVSSLYQNNTQVPVLEDIIKQKIEIYKEICFFNTI